MSGRQTASQQQLVPSPWLVAAQQWEHPTPVLHPGSDVERLDRLRDAHWAMALAGNKSAVATVLRCIELKSKITGVISNDTPSMSPVAEALQIMLEAARQKRSRMYPEGEVVPDDE